MSVPFNEHWLEPGAAIPVDIETTAILLNEIIRLREWIGLTDEEAWGMLGQMSLGASIEDVLLVEAKLKAKNT